MREKWKTHEWNIGEEEKEPVYILENELNLCYPEEHFIETLD